MLAYDETALRRALGQLSSRARMAFASACASRLAAAYGEARDALGITAPDLLLPTLRDIWLFLEDSPAETLWTARAEQLAGQISSEDGGGRWQAIIDDALAATAYAVRAGEDVEDAVFCARRLYEAVDAQAQNAVGSASFTPEVEALLRRHPIVQQELSRQSRDLNDLKSADGLRLLRSRAFSETALPQS